MLTAGRGGGYLHVHGPHAAVVHPAGHAVSLCRGLSSTSAATNLTLGGGLTWLYEGNLEIEDQPGIGGEVNGRYSNVSLYIFSFYARWH